MPVVEVLLEDQFSTLTKADPAKLVSLYFHTEWAEPCVNMNVIYRTLSDDASNKDVLFLSIDAEAHADIADVFEVTAVPYFIIIRNSTILKELSGADPKEFIAALRQFSTPAPAAAPAPAAQPEQPQADRDESPDALNERLKKLTTAASVMLFMKGSPSSPQCGFSRQLVAILREHQVRFGFFDILKDDSVRQGLKTFSDWPTFPQLYINGEFQGGLDIIKESIEEDPNFFENAIAT